MNFQKILLLSATLLLSAAGFPQAPAGLNVAFREGEQLHYHINFYSILTGQVKAGDFDLTVAGEKKSLNNLSTYHCIASGMTTWDFDFFYKVNDRFETFIDEYSLYPVLALRRIRETDFIRNEDLVFDQKGQRITYKNNLKGNSRLIRANRETLDLLSAVYYLRTVKIPSGDMNAEVMISYVFADSLRTSTIKFMGTETLRTSIGQVNCIKVKPQVLVGNVFSSEYPLTVWITNDQNRLPVLVESRIVLGKVRVELVSWSGLRNPFHALKPENN